MVDSFVRVFVVLLVGVFLISCPPLNAKDRKTEDNRLAKVAGEADRSDPDRLEVVSDEPVIPGWLHDLLAKPPELDEIEVSAEEPRNLEAELEESLEKSPASPGPTMPEADNHDNSDFGPARSIPPLYTAPALEGEGVWTSENMPADATGAPLGFKTSYRPSEEYPNSIVHMAVFDMKRLKMRFFVGNTEPGVYQVSYSRDSEDLSRIVAITNAMWMQQHARGAGAIFRGQVIYPMVAGMATLVVYHDDSVDILEWSDEIPLNLVKDARQLRHLMVKNGLVVDKVLKNGKLEEAEIGLGGFLVDNGGSSTMRNKFWFLANRTAFGIRQDGNLVFAMGHHVSTKDLGKALVLAGCARAIHGDANIHNIVCNLYFRDEKNKVVKRDKLSPEQLKYTLNRYDYGYGKDFFAIYEK
jgi:hypothetical protein